MTATATVKHTVPALVRQSYGIACAQTTFGGPVGIWLECTTCDESQVIVGSNEQPTALYPNAKCAAIFRHHGWKGRGPNMKRAKCPQCAKAEGRAS